MLRKVEITCHSVSTPSHFGSKLNVQDEAEVQEYIIYLFRRRMMFK